MVGLSIVLVMSITSVMVVFVKRQGLFPKWIRYLIGLPLTCNLIRGPLKLV